MSHSFSLSLSSYNFDRPTFCSLNISDDDLIRNQYSWAPIVYVLDVHRQRN